MRKFDINYSISSHCCCYVVSVLMLVVLVLHVLNKKCWMCLLFLQWTFLIFKLVNVCCVFVFSLCSRIFIFEKSLWTDPIKLFSNLCCQVFVRFHQSTPQSSTYNNHVEIESLISHISTNSIQFQIYKFNSNSIQSHIYKFNPISIQSNHSIQIQSNHIRYKFNPNSIQSQIYKFNPISTNWIYNNQQIESTTNWIDNKSTISIWPCGAIMDYGLRMRLWLIIGRYYELRMRLWLISCRRLEISSISSTSSISASIIT